LRYILGVLPLGDRARPLEFGDCFHKAQAEFWTREGDVRERLQAAMRVWLSVAGTLSWEDQIIGAQLLIGYAAYYQDDALRQVALPIAERKLLLPLPRPDGTPDPELMLVAKMDAVCYDSDLNTVLVEHKTTTSDLQGATYWDRMKRSSQITTYMLAAEACGRRPAYLLLDAVRAPALRRLRATPAEHRKFYQRDGKYGKVGDPMPGTRLADETQAEFTERIRAAVVGAPHAYFARQQFVRTDAELYAARCDLWATGQLMLAVAKNGGAAPRNEDGCDKFGRRCEFDAACFQGQLQNEQLYRIRNKELL
jgi:hypothetical protein